MGYWLPHIDRDEAKLEQRITSKEASFILSIYDCVVTMQKWQAHITQDIDTTCLSYQVSFKENIIHYFHHFPKTQRACRPRLLALYVAL